MPKNAPIRKTDQAAQHIAPGLFITARKPVRNKPALLRIFVGKLAVGNMSIDQADELGFTLGAPWTELKQQLMSTISAEHAATADGVRLLVKRPMPRKVLEQALQDRGHSAAAIASAGQTFDALGLINDRSFAAAFATGRIARSRSESSISRDLKRRGVDAKIIKSAVDQARSDDGRSDLCRAEELARSRLKGSLRTQPPATQRRRLYALLARRGFDGELCESIVRKLISGADQSSVID